MSNYVIEVLGLTKKYKRVLALDNFTMRVGEKTIHGLLGPNGAGKTTAIKCILGMLIPNSGFVKVLGRPVRGDLNWNVKSRIGYVPEYPRFPEWARVGELLEAYAKFYGLSNVKDGVGEVLGELGLLEKIDFRVGELSRGQRQKLAIAQAILHKPELVILDEPLIGLDPESIVEVRKLIASLPSKGSTVLISSHILKEIEEIATHLTVVFRGRALFEGGVEELKAKSRGGVRARVVLGEAGREVSKIVESLPYVESVELVKPNVFIVSFRGGDFRARLNRDLVNYGLQVVEISLEEESLEDAYLKLLGGRSG